MTSILFAVIGLLIGALCVYLISGKNSSTLSDENKRLSADIASKTTENSLLNKKLTDEAERYNNQLKETSERYERQIADINDKNIKDKTDTEARYQQEKKEENERRERQLKEQLDMVEQRMTNATQLLLKQRSKELDETNHQQMGSILDPLKLTMEQMRKALDDSNIKNAENTSSLKEQIRSLLESTQNIGQEADKLSRALHSKTKVQGNFGEMILSELLEKFGFKQGVEYDVQETLRDESGKALKNDETGSSMITDVILHYPDGKDVIIDSKVSLTAFTDYVNADNDDERDRLLKEHVRSVRRQVDILSKKDYSSYVKRPHVALDYVIMFVPIESALVLALSNDTNLWREAFEKKVFITGEQNLFAVLRMIQIAWTQKHQTENQEKVFGLANNFIDRVGDFIKRFNDVGAKIDSSVMAFKSAKDKLIDGRQNLMKPAQDLIKLGAKQNPKHPLPSVEDEDASNIQKISE